MAENRTPATTPVVQVSTEHWDEVLQATEMFPVLKAMRETTILAVTNEDISGAAEQARQVFGTRVVRVPAAELRRQYERVSEIEAETWSERWRRGARRVTDVNRNVLLDNARMYVAVRELMERTHARTVAIDCPSMRSQPGEIPLPCLAHFQLNNDGATAVCTANVDLACAQTLISTISRRPGIMARPVDSVPGKGVTLAHTACTNKIFGSTGDTNRYHLRNAAQEHRTVYIQSVLPKSQPITLVDLDLAHRQMRIASADAAGGPENVDRCRTCIFARTKQDLAAVGSPANRPCVMHFGAYAKRAAFAARLAKLDATPISEATA